ncbi:MAG: GNAT family N-acetyltransferase [Saprospiraceae bacterium]
MYLEDAFLALQLSLDEGWNQTEKDWKFLIGNSLNICLLAEYENKVIGTTVAITYSEEVAWIGMVLVDKAYRGFGLSKVLLNSVFNKLTAYKSIKLDATPKGLQVYTTLDFKEEYAIVRMVNSFYHYQSLNSETSGTIDECHASDIETMIDLDAKIFGSKRSLLIEYLVKEYPAKAWCIKKDNYVSGFVLGREGSRYHHIGPVIAKNDTDAKLLILRALSELQHKPVVVDVPEDKPDLLNWLSSIGFVEQRRFVRMYRNENVISTNKEQLFAIAGPEYG